MNLFSDELRLFKLDGFGSKNHLLCGQAWFHFHVTQQCVTEGNEREKKQVKHGNGIRINELTHEISFKQ